MRITKKLHEEAMAKAYAEVADLKRRITLACNNVVAREHELIAALIARDHAIAAAEKWREDSNEWERKYDGLKRAAKMAEVKRRRASRVPCSTANRIVLRSPSIPVHLL